MKPEGEHDKVRVRCSEESKKRFGVEAVRIGGDIEPPDRILDGAVNFPELPRGTTVSPGVWIGEILIAPDGAVANTWAVREFQLNPPFPAFNQAIHTTLRKWKYEPVIVEGDRIAVCMTVTVSVNWVEMFMTELVDSDSASNLRLEWTWPASSAAEFE